MSGPRRRLSIGTQVFVAIVTVAVGVIATAGVVARVSVSRALLAYLAALPTPPAGMGRGRQLILGAAEQSLITGVNRGVLAGVVAAALVAAAAAWLLARRIGRPLHRLEQAALQLATGDLTHRVDVDGPGEIAVLGEAFNDMADSLQQAEAMRQRLVADVAHELRNPLAAIRAQVEGMSEGVLPADAARLGSVTEDVLHLSALIDDLQELSVAESGRLRYTMRPVDLSALVAREAERHATATHEGVTLTWDASATAVVEGDDIRLSQVVRNLLGNAIRHTRCGTIIATVIIDAGSAVVTVTDTGEGIAHDDLPYVFERFYRADSARASHTGGSGLGLAIARRIVLDHGGTVLAQSVLGEGSSIGFRVPLA